MSEGSIGPVEVGALRYSNTAIRYPRSGSPIDSIATYSGSERYRVEYASGISQMEVPFGHQSLSTPSIDRLFVGNGDGFRIEVYAYDGRHLASIRSAHDPVPVTDALRQRFMDDRFSADVYQSRPDAAERQRGWLNAAPSPATMPAYDNLIVDATGRPWARVYFPPWESANTWRVFAPEGYWLGDVALPAGLEPFEIGTDYVLGRVVDDLGVEYVQLHRLH